MKSLLGLGGVLLAAAALLLGLSHISATANHAPGTAQRPVLVELFTSQGCSSCPPADRLLGELDAAGAAVALSRPVTSWDELGWKDTLARGGNDRLQRDYAARAIPGSGAYTPEAVVGGAAATAGTDAPALRGLIAAQREAGTTTLAQKGGEVVASAPRANVELRFVAIRHKAAVKVDKGENRGRTLGYTNVVLAEEIAPCDPSLACRAPFPERLAHRKGADRWAAVLQDRDGGAVRAVRWIRPAAD
ncbi:DUF1223 domain-containing protein [Sphingopyxis sp. GW247-27LB]|uniref:DUF1223 domain-containing protein n=1 Tax=Sphingopyxis sp. GW247-27LB TaxID=2012632 RepID=UPI000BA6A38F|nr:DUF1223 domain-containing protein [Sphingopyxis sp. GW247-27LB]PAL19467.1 DUF1223 domain-containing protein [Sphingopyxis sp. GW247-27LB]